MSVDEFTDEDLVTRIKNNQKLYTDEEVRGKDPDKDMKLDSNDGWE